MRVLCIEDSESILENICEILTMEGYEAIRGIDGEIGVQLAIREIPDFIICNIQMPKMDGYQVIQIIRAFSSTKHIPFLFLSAHASKLDIKKGIMLGADYYITKPFKLTELLNVLDRRSEGVRG